MKLSRTGVKFNKFRGDEESLSQEILFQSSQLKRHAAGVYGLGHFLIRSRNKLIECLRKKLYEFECAEISLPILQPASLWKKSGRFDVFTKNNQMFAFEGRNGSWCMAPTGEEVVVDFIKNNIVSYKDMPVNVFQINNKYRDEIRVRGGLMRSKEFIMKDGYSFHVSHSDMVKEYEKMKLCYKNFFSEVELDTIIVGAVSADMGGNVSEEFMTPAIDGEDKILIDESLGVALNVEVLQNSEKLIELKKEFPNFSIDKLKEISCIELGHVFQLGTVYSEKMEGLFTDKDGEKKPYYMACYGIGVNRVLGAICNKFSKDDGLVWPKKIAPYEVAVIYSNKCVADAMLFYEKFKQSGIEVILFDSDDGFGSKMKNAKLLGIPKIAIFGETFQNENKIEIEDRKPALKSFVEKDQIINFLSHKK